MLSSMRVFTMHSLKRSNVQQPNTITPSLRMLSTLVSICCRMVSIFSNRATACSYIDIQEIGEGRSHNKVT